MLRRKGYGVHSPFVYHLITRVIGEHCPYYRFNDIEKLRAHLLLQEEEVIIPSASGERRLTVGRLVAREAISPRIGALLFRLTNYFKPSSILQVGTSIGLSTLYLTSYSPGLRCVSLENVAACSDISQQVYAMAARSSIDLRTGDYRTILPAALEDLRQLDFVFFNIWNEPSPEWLFDVCLKYVGPQTVFVFEGIKGKHGMRSFWKTICARPEVSVTIDLSVLGIVFFNKNLHKQNYRI
jgi:predicted O-methyltransferase YrrM